MELNPFKARRDREAQELAQLRWLSKLVREDLEVVGAWLEFESSSSPEGRAERDEVERIYRAALPALRSAETREAVLAVQTSVADAFFHRARSQAHDGGVEPPARSDPCAFNPQHGPAVTEVEWTPIGGPSAVYASCQGDADLVAAGMAPRARQIKLGDRSVAWYDVQAANMSIADRKEMWLATDGGYAQVAAGLAQLRSAPSIGSSGL
jgi:hypothetical protein